MAGSGAVGELLVRRPNATEPPAVGMAESGCWNTNNTTTTTPNNNYYLYIIISSSSNNSSSSSSRKTVSDLCEVRKPRLRSPIEAARRRNRRPDVPTSRLSSPQKRTQAPEKACMQRVVADECATATATAAATAVKAASEASRVPDSEQCLLPVAVEFEVVA